MPRSRAKVPAHARHKKILKQAKGFRNRRKNTFSNAVAAVWKAGEYAYVGRKVKKRQFRSLWISAHQRRRPDPRRRADLFQLHQWSDQGRH